MQSKNTRTTSGRLKEFLRKTMVSLKRKPQLIPLLMLAAGFLYYSLNLTRISNTTARIQLRGMGLSGFCTMLFSLLCLVCYLNAYPHRKKTNIPMLVLSFLMMGVLIFSDSFYASCIITATTRANDPIATTGIYTYISDAYRMLIVHRILVALGALLAALLPLLRKALRKIDTSLPVEESAQMEDLVLSDET